MGKVLVPRLTREGVLGRALKNAFNSAVKARILDDSQEATKARITRTATIIELAVAATKNNESTYPITYSKQALPWQQCEKAHVFGSGERFSWSGTAATGFQAWWLARAVRFELWCQSSKWNQSISCADCVLWRPRRVWSCLLAALEKTVDFRYI